MMKKERIIWLDIVKLLGITAIFCGHLGTGAGNLYDFVFLYHVPLFFFVSGIFAVRLESLSFKEALKKRFEQIIIPYIFFVLITMFVIIMTNEKDFITYLKYVKQFIWGIRNQMYANSLWFFSCLFCMSMLFDVLRRLLKRKSLILLAVICIYVLSVTIFPQRPDRQPSWVLNIDSACFYMIYYAFGYLLSGFLQKPMRALGGWRKAVCLTGIVVLVCYAVSVYTGDDIIAQLIYRKLSEASEIYNIFRTMLLILLNILAARLLTGFDRLAMAGTQTLWLCGNEFIVKQIFNTVVSVFGWRITISSAFAAVIYAVFMIIFTIRVLVPIEMRIYRRYIDCIRQLCPALLKEE